MSNNDTSDQEVKAQKNAEPPSRVPVIAYGLGALFGLIAGLNSLFHFAPPLIFGIAAGVCFVVGHFTGKA